MSMFTDDMMPHQHLIEYLKDAGVENRVQIKILRLIWNTEKNGWSPPRLIHKRLQELLRQTRRAERRKWR